MGISFPADGANVSDRWDRVFKALSAEPRRELAISLTDRSALAWVPLPDAAHSPHYSGSEDELRIDLYHKHLPILAESEYIVWEDSPFEARRGPNFGEIEAVIRAITDGADDLPDQLIRDCRALEQQVDSP